MPRIRVSDYISFRSKNSSLELLISYIYYTRLSVSTVAWGERPKPPRPDARRTMEGRRVSSFLGARVRVYLMLNPTEIDHPINVRSVVYKQRYTQYTVYFSVVGTWNNSLTSSNTYTHTHTHTGTTADTWSPKIISSSHMCIALVRVCVTIIVRVGTDFSLVVYKIFTFPSTYNKNGRDETIIYSDPDDELVSIKILLFSRAVNFFKNEQNMLSPFVSF